jgi:hypothetical protein
VGKYQRLARAPQHQSFKELCTVRVQVDVTGPAALALPDHERLILMIEIADLERTELADWPWPACGAGYRCRAADRSPQESERWESPPLEPRRPCATSGLFGSAIAPGCACGE